MKSGVYQIKNEVNGKRYIGSAVNLSQRKSQHFSRLRRGDHPNVHLKRSVEVHGVDAFTFSVLVHCPKDRVLEWEQIALDSLEPEYNICPVAGNTAGRKFSEETKEKIRKAAIGRKYPPRSAEYRAKVSERCKGQKLSKEHMEAFQRGRANRVYTDEQRERTSKSLKKAYADGCRSRVKTKEHANRIGKTIAKLSDDQIIEIFKLKANGVTGVALAKMFSVPTSSISLILSRKTYKWVNIDG